MRFNDTAAPVAIARRRWRWPSTLGVMTMASQFLSVLALLSIAAGSIAAAELPAPTIRLVVAGHEILLDAPTQQRVISQIETIVCSANFDSEHHPKLFQTQTNTPEQIIKDSFLLIAYPSAHTFETIGGRLTARTVVIALADRELPGRIFLREGKKVVRIDMESGQECVHLARLPGLAEHLPPRIRDNLPKYNYVK